MVFIFTLTLSEVGLFCFSMKLRLEFMKNSFEYFNRDLVSMGAMGALATAILRKGNFSTRNFEEKQYSTNKIF